MAREALQRLLADVWADSVDMIPVYKIDRSTRFLADVTKLMKTLEAAYASFVSVTPSLRSPVSVHSTSCLMAGARIDTCASSHRSSSL